MCWKTQEHKCWINIGRSWCRLTNMDDERLNKKVFKWAKYIGTECGIKNWIYQVSTFFESIGMGHICTSNERLHCPSLLCDLDVVLSHHYFLRWHDLISKVDSKKGTGKNKLRTYKLFKFNIELQEYVHLSNRHHRSALAKFRCGEDAGQETQRVV